MKPFLKWALLLGFIAAFSLACHGCGSDTTHNAFLFPSTVTATAGDGKVTLEWSRGIEEHFHIYYAQTSGVSSYSYMGMQEVISSRQDSDAVSVDVTGLTNGTTYYFVVTALRENLSHTEESRESNKVSATPSATPHPPAAPTEVQATPGNGQVTVEWNPVGGATSYNVYYASNPGVTTSSAKVSGAASGQTITGLTNGTTYYFRVTAINAEGESGLSLEVSATPSATPQPPAAPTGVRGTPGDGQIKVEWNPVGGATSYNIYYSTSSPVTKSTGTKVAGVTSPQPITGLNNGTTYYFVVTAVNTVGESNESQEASATPAVPVGVLGVISIALNGMTGNGPSPPATGFGYGPPSLSDDGRYVAFTSSANDLVTFSLGATTNIYLREPLGMHTYIVSVANNGTAADGSSVYPSISADGRYVVFFSTATNLDMFSNCNQNGDVYVRDRQTPPNTFRVTLYKDPDQGTIKQLCSMMFSSAPAISADGRWVAYSKAGLSIYLHDTVTLDYINNIGTPPPEASIGTYGSQNPVLSGDGSLVAFVSDWNLDKTPGKDGIMNVWLYNRNTGITVRVTNASAAGVIARQISMSRDGRYIAYVSSDKEIPGDTNAFSDVYVREMTGPYRDIPGPPTRVSVANDGSEANNSSWSPSINSTGSIVAFASAATNLVAGDTGGKSDIFVRDIQSGKTRRVSVGTDGTQANADSSYPAISPNGTVVGFDSTLTNLMVPGMDANNAMDTFIASTGSAPSLIPP